MITSALLIKALSISPDGRFLVSGSSDNTIKVWDVAQRRVVHSLEGHSGQVLAVAVTPDSRYAVDIAMPVGTGIYAARSGRVIEVASSNYRGGFDTSRNGAQANFVRILHADGTFAIMVL